MLISPINRIKGKILVEHLDFEGMYFRIVAREYHIFIDLDNRAKTHHFINNANKWVITMRMSNDYYTNVAERATDLSDAESGDQMSHVERFVALTPKSSDRLFANLID